MILSVIGFVNKRFNFIHSVFVCYPASKEYTLAYAFESKLHHQSWTPWLIGIYKQDGKWGLMFTISSLEEDFIKPENIGNIKNLVKNTDAIKDLVYASQKSFAGILPGVMYAKRIIRDTIEVDVTIQAVKQAISSVLSLNSYASNTPIIVLGGHGFVGRRLLKQLSCNEFYSVDIQTNKEFPEHLIGKEAVLINISRKSAIKDYVGKFWKDLIVMNEVYPEPSQEEVNLIKQRGSSLYHIVGVRAASYPSFPHAYKGGIPCCAAWNSGDDMEVLIKEMN